MKQLILLLFASSIFWGCSDILTNQYPYGEEFTLDHGKSALVGGETLVQFKRVKEDSRCPTDAECVWAGNAAVEVTVKVSGNDPKLLVLNTHQNFPQEMVVNGVRVALIDVYPYPTTAGSIKPDEYKVRLLLER